MANEIQLDFSKAQPIDQPAAAVQLDFSKAEPILEVSAPEVGHISAQPKPDGIAGKVSAWAENVMNDIKNGTDNTGVGTVLKKMGAHGVYSGNSQEVGDFMASLPLGLLRLGKGYAEGIGAKTPSDSLQAGKDIAGGALQASTIPASFVAPETPEAAAAFGSKVASAAGKVTDAASGAVSAGKSALGLAHQDELQTGLRSAVEALAKDNGVGIPAKGSIRGMVESIADQVQAKAKSQYQVIDEATGGAFKNVQDAIKNIQLKLRQTAGTDDAMEAQLTLNLSAQQAKMQNVIKQAEQAGVDPKLLQEANGTWKKAQALYDLDSQVKKSVSGVRAGMKEAANNPEVIDPKKLISRLNNLYDSGRLQEATGDSVAEDLINAASKSERMARRAKSVTSAAKKTALGAAALVGGREAIKLIPSH
jgi:hypothetical protein